MSTRTIAAPASAPAPAPAAAAPMPPASPAASTAPVAAAAPAAPRLPALPTVNVGARYSATGATQSQRQSNQVINERLVMLGALPESFRTSTTFGPESQAALNLVEAALKANITEYANGPVGDGWVRATRPGPNGAMTPAAAGSTVGAMDLAISRGFRFNADRTAFAIAAPAAPTTHATPAPAGSTPAAPSAPGATPAAPAAAASTPPAAPSHPVSPRSFEDQEGLRYLLGSGIGIYANSAEVVAIDEEIAGLLETHRESDPVVQEALRRRDRAVATAREQSGKEGIMGGVHAFEEGRIAEGIGEVVGGAVRTVGSVPSIVSDQITSLGAVGRDWARSERARLTTEGKGEINGAASLGLYVVEYVGVAADFLFNIHDAEWYQWVLPSKWVSGLLWLAGQLAQALANIASTVWEALFDGIQWIVDAIKGSSSSHAPTIEEQKRQLEVQISATNAEIARLRGLERRTSAQEGYLAALVDLASERESLKRVLGMPESSQRTTLIENERNVVEAWRAYAESLRGPAGAAQTAATSAEVAIPPARSTPEATAPAATTPASTTPAATTAPASTPAAAAAPAPAPATGSAPAPARAPLAARR